MYERVKKTKILPKFTHARSSRKKNNMFMSIMYPTCINGYMIHYMLILIKKTTSETYYLYFTA